MTQAPAGLQGQNAARRNPAGGLQEDSENGNSGPHCPLFLLWNPHHAIPGLYRSIIFRL
jgi:hypothetical protein